MLTTISLAHLRGGAPSEKASRVTPAPLGVADVVWLTLFVTVLACLSLMQSWHKMFWGDEIMGAYVLRAGSLHRFWVLWCAGIDSSGLWYYVFAKPWDLLFRASDLGLRLFSAAGLIASGCLVWLAARRFYTPSVVAAGIFTIFLDLNVLRWQLANARCYGVFMAANALVLYLIVRGSDETHEAVRPRFVIATFVAYNILAGSHILGMLYAGTFLAIQITLDLWTRRKRLALYAAATAGITCAVLASFQNIRSTTALGKPVFWTVKPPWRTVVFWNPKILGSVAVVVGVLALLSFMQARREATRDPVYILLLGLVLLHAIFVVISHTSTSIYDTRYLVPLSFGLVLAIAEMLTQMREASGTPHARFVFVLALVWIVALQEAPKPSSFGLPIPDYTEQFLADLPSGLPVIDTEIESFVEEEFYHHGHFGRPFAFPIDQAVSNDFTFPGGVSGFHEMDNFYRLGINAPDLQPTAKLLDAFPDFVVVTGSPPTRWFSKRVLDTNRYDTVDLGEHVYLDRAFHFWRVHRR